MNYYDFKRGLQLDRVLRFVGSEFTPPQLLNNVNLDSYARKLSEFANFLICGLDGEDIGFIAFYENKISNELYITLIAVRQDLQHHGYGSDLLCQFEQKYKGTLFTEIKLEVDKDNLNAYDFYRKHGFHEIEDRSQKLLMGKRI